MIGINNFKIRADTEKYKRYNFWIGVLTVVLILGFGFTACDAPAGPEGPQGPEGPVGPAGEDGSMIYADEGEPGNDIGDIGDYYLDQNTGKLYGPKNDEGWGDPILVLMGEDGQDGEDGSQIYSGSGAPDASLGVVGDYYLNKDIYDLYGPKTSDGWGEPINLQGPVGPAGEDGSVIHAGEGQPDNSVGTEGDYYLDQNTGELYGPKDADGWGNPIIVLMGEDGQDGADGEDGSQIHSGSGAPDASLGVVGDYYLDKDNYDLYGPKTSDGWGTPLNLKGADGNANVTRYIFPGHDFTSAADTTLSFGDIENESEMHENAWLVYLVFVSSSFTNYYQIPGHGNFGDSEYRTLRRYDTFFDEANLQILLQNGPGEEYDQIEIVRIEASETVDNRKQKGDAIIPDHLDVSNYEEVARYYGFWQ